MKKNFTLLIVMCGLFAVVNAQTALDPNLTLNAQITEAGVYTVEAGQFYAFDGQINLTFEVTIEGPDNGWIIKDATPPVLVGIPPASGDPKLFFEIKEGGALTIKNVMMSGVNAAGQVAKNLIRNTGGNKLVVDNCVITDWQDFSLRNGVEESTMSITNCVFINGMRLGVSKWGGFPLRMDKASNEMVFENNTTINTGRLMTNGGPFLNANVYQLHNTFINQSVIAEETRAKEYMIANNIYYNYHFLGYKNENSTEPYDVYASYFTGNCEFGVLADTLESISWYLGQNLLFREQSINDWFVGKDSISASLLWEHATVDSFLVIDDNSTIGTNYTEIEPGFLTPPGNTAKIIENIQYSYYDPTGDWVDWRITSPVSFSDEGIPALSWPPAFDMSYSNEGLQSAGTDGLPLGDLNWFPEKKAEYLAGRDGFLDAIRDSMVNAVAVYNPETMENTPMITEIVTSVEQISAVSGQFDLSNYPNPFNQSTAIKLRLPQQSNVTLSVYNVVGVKVFELTENELPSGTHLFNIDASNLSSGIYLYRVNAIGRDGQNFVGSKKMIKE